VEKIFLWLSDRRCIVSFSSNFIFSDPKGEKAAADAKAAEQKKKAAAAKKAATADLDALLDVGLGKGKKK
jgi:cyclopropane fatty-acyl-phospholipid synthase-like methyltransferase